MNYTPLLWVGICFAVLVGQVYLLGRKMSVPENMMRPNPGGLSEEQRAIFLYYNDWLTSVGLEFRTSFQFGTIQVAVFQHKDQPRFFSFQFHKQVTFAAESYLADLTILDTGSSSSIGMFPRPGAYAQSFPNISAQELWQRHLEGEAHLTQKFGFHWVPLNRPYEELVVEAMRIRMNYNRSQSFWPVRVLYRFFVTRHRLVNRTIMQQFP